MRLWAKALVAGAAAVVAAPAAVAQQTSAPQPSAGPSFMIFRYASVHSLAMYSGYHAGGVLLVAGLLENPRTSYREVMGAVGLPFGGSAFSLTLAPALGYQDTGWYAEAYLLPALQRGRLHAEATVELAQPFKSAGTRGAYVWPAMALVDVTRGVRLGVTYYGSVEDGNAPTHGAGPAVQVAVPQGSITFELVKGLVNTADEFRLALRSSL